MPVLLTPPYLQFLTTDGTNTPLAFGTVTTYAAGTTTLKSTYTDAAGLTLAPNPIQLNAAGIPQTGNGGIWITGSYKIIVKDQFGVVVDDQDHVTSFNNVVTATNPLADTFSGNGSQTSFTLSQSLGTDPKTIMVFVAAPTAGFFQKFSGTGSQTVFTLSAAKGTDPNSLAVYVYDASLTDKFGFEIRDPSTYTISGTTLTFTVAPVTGTNNIYISQPTAQNTSGIAGVIAPSAYTLNGTTLTFASAPVTGTNNIIVFAPTTLVGAAALSAAAADASATAAGNSATAAAADVVLTHADVVLTHADVVLTHADVVTTGINATTSTTQAGIATTQATNAAASAVAAAASAALAAGSLLGTSTTSNTIGTGSKTFTTQTGLDLGLGFVTVAETSVPSNYFHGQITSYNSGTGSLVVNVLDTGGSGTHTDWTISVSGPAGPAGTLGTTGTPISGYIATFSSPTTLTGTAATVGVTQGGFGRNTIGTANQIPQVNGTADGFVYTYAMNQSLQTVDSPTFAALTLTAPLTVANGGIGAATVTSNSVILGNGSSALNGNLVAPSTSGNVLTSNGTTWQSTAPSAGSYILLSTQTAATSATLDFNSIITSAYDEYVFLIKDLISASGGCDFAMLSSVNNGSTYQSAYDYCNNGYAALGTSTSFTFRAAANDSSMVLNLATNDIGTTGANSISGEIRYYNPNSTARIKAAKGWISYNGAGAKTSNHESTNQATTAVNAIRFKYTAGNITSGKIYCYGVKNT